MILQYQGHRRSCHLRLGHGYVPAKPRLIMFDSGGSADELVLTVSAALAVLVAVESPTAFRASLKRLLPTPWALTAGSAAFAPVRIGLDSLDKILHRCVA